MQPTLARHTTVYFLAEAPGRHEDEESGRPLTGPSGKLVRSVIPKGAEASCSFDNVVRDRPPKNRTPVFQEIECCRGHVVKSIEEAKPRVIIGLGAVPLNWMIGSSDMAAQRGRVFAMCVGNHSCWYVPTYHPSYVLRVAYQKDKPLNSRIGYAFKVDIEKAFGLVGEPPPQITTVADVRAGIQAFPGSMAADGLLKLLDAAIAAPVKAIDIETSALRPYAKNARILTAAISFDDTHFSFAIDHPHANWDAGTKGAILKKFKRLLEDDTIKIAHNAPFEIEWLIGSFGREFVKHDKWECTQMQAHILDERRSGQSLDALCRQHFGLAYKGTFNLDKKNMAASNLLETLIYNAADTKFTLKLWHLQNRLLEDRGLADAYYEALPRQPTVALMQQMGIEADQEVVKSSQTKLQGEIDELHKQITGLKVVQAYERDHKAFNPMSNPEAIVIFRDYLKCPEVELEDGRFSVDRNILDKIDHPLAKFLVELRNRNKLKSTYVDCFELGKGAFIWPDAKIHPSFNTTFAETGRTSSDQPNQQNWPMRKDAWVRRQIVAPKGHVIVAFDYGQLEACTAAICSRDKVLVKALWDDYDIHMEWTQRLVKRYPLLLGGTESLSDKPTAKKYRSLVKNKLVFPAIFGAANNSIAGYLKTPEEVIDDLMDEFWSTFHGLKQWQDNLMKSYYDRGYVESPTGRRHNYPLSRNQAINFPIQSFACDIVCDAMNRLSYLASTTNQWHLHPIWNIHDDLGFYIRDDDAAIAEAIEKIRPIMLKPPYKFINVPMSIEGSLGYNWFEMGGIGKFWSHKDL